MLLLIVGMVVMLGTHLLPAFPDFRATIVDRLGVMGYRALFSIGSVVGLILIIWGYGEARAQPIVIYDPPFWLRHVTFLLMLPVFPLLLAAYFPGRIKAAVKHPMLISVKTWAFAHLLANGTAADLILFGGILAWAVFDLRSAKTRAVTAPVFGGTSTKQNDVIAVVGGLIIYAVFILWAHSYLIGVPVLGG